MACKRVASATVSQSVPMLASNASSRAVWMRTTGCIDMSLHLGIDALERHAGHQAAGTALVLGGAGERLVLVIAFDVDQRVRTARLRGFLQRLQRAQEHPLAGFLVA